MVQHLSNRLRASLWPHHDQNLSLSPFKPTVQELVVMGLAVPIHGPHTQEVAHISRALNESGAYQSGDRNDVDFENPEPVLPLPPSVQAEHNQPEVASSIAPSAVPGVVPMPVCPLCNGSECTARYGARIWTPEFTDPVVLVYPSASAATSARLSRNRPPQPERVRYSQTEAYHHAMPFKSAEVHRITLADHPESGVIVPWIVHEKYAWRRFCHTTQYWGMDVLARDIGRLENLFGIQSGTGCGGSNTVGAASETEDVMQTQAARTPVSTPPTPASADPAAEETVQTPV